MTSKFKFEEKVKCASDPIYYLNTYGKVFDARYNTVSQMQCFGYQEDLLKDFLDYQNNIILKSRQCLPEGNMINTTNGMVAIEKIKNGTDIFSYNFENNCIEKDVVVEKWESSGLIQCVKIYLNDGRVFEVGENHPFFLLGRKWTASKIISSGDQILCNDGKYADVEKVEVSEKKKCYDISVKKNENYFLDGLLTHNTGISVLSAGYVAWKLLFSKDEKIIIIANNIIGAKRFLKTVKNFIENTPDFLKPGERENSQTKIEFDNGCWAEARAASPQAGRGDSITLLVLDEFAFVDYDEDIWTAAKTALSITNGDCIIISTPYGVGNKFYEFWLKSNNREAGFEFNPVTVHWKDNPIANVGLEERIDEKTGKKYYWSPWYESMKATFSYNPVKIAQELDLSFEGSKASVFDQFLVLSHKNRLETEKVKPICYYNHNVIMSERFQERTTDFWIWKTPEKGEKYIIGGDVARGGIGDYSTLQIINIKTLEQVGEYRGKIDPDDFAELINGIGKIYNDAFLAIEANSFGTATTLLLNRRLGYKNMFFSKNVKQIHARFKNYSEAVNEDELMPGFQTTSETRPLLIDCLTRHLKEGVLKINSIRLLLEFDTFTYNKHGKPEHESGYHDDLIFAYMIAIYIRETDYQNATKSKELTKSMLDAFSFNKSSYQEDLSEKEPLFKKKEESKEGFTFFTSKGLNNDPNEEDDNDLSWLLK